MFSIYKDSVVSIQTYKGTADNESLTGAGVDMKGFRAVAFIVGAAGGETFSTWSIKAQQDSDSGFGTAADLVGTATAFATADTPTDGLAILEIVEPKERYVRPIITVPNVSTAKNVFCIAIKYGAEVLPTTNATGEQHVSPAEGTA